ncbi:MAG: electron transport complex subunit RsxC [Oscillospiraceae bacterium]
MEKKYLFALPARGVDVPHRKNTENCATGELISPNKVMLPLSQHIGKPAQVCVKKGDAVFVGTLVGKADGFVSANIHSSVSGTVLGLAELVSTSGAPMTCVEIESDKKFTPDPSLQRPVVTDAKQLVEAVAQSGLVGLGGAGFPTHVKLAIPKNAHIDTLIINGAECEPYITSDYREMLESTADIVEGVLLVKKLLGLERAVIAVEKNKPKAIEALKMCAKDTGIEIVALKCTYPQGAEKVLISSVAKRQVPAGKLPSDAGVLVLNVCTVSFINKYMKSGMPLVQKRVTVDGGAVTEGKNLLVPIGTRISELVEACKGYSCEPKKLLMGGPMMGISLCTDDYPILKNNNAVIALSQQEVKLCDNNPCIRCGRCIKACPMRLSPAEIQLCYELGDTKQQQELGVMNCIECGSCTFVCPAMRSITQTMRLSKAAVRKETAKK